MEKIKLFYIVYIRSRFFMILTQNTNVSSLDSTIMILQLRQVWYLYSLSLSFNKNSLCGFKVQISEPCEGTGVPVHVDKGEERSVLSPNILD